jgi:hypothetical protein
MMLAVRHLHAAQPRSSNKTITGVRRAIGSIDVDSVRLCKVEEDDARRIADGRVKVGEVEATGFAVHAEDGEFGMATIILPIRPRRAIE